MFFLSRFLKISIPKYTVGIYETTSVAKQTRLASMRLLSQFRSIVEVRTNIITTSALPAKKNRRPLHTLYYDNGTSEPEGYAFAECGNEEVRKYSRTGSK